MSELKRFITVNKIEGISYLILLFAAMPAKYLFGYPMATKIVGLIHGILVILFLLTLYDLKKKVSMNSKEALHYFILSLIPFGSFKNDTFLRKRYLQEEDK